MPVLQAIRIFQTKSYLIHKKESIIWLIKNWTELNEDLNLRGKKDSVLNSEPLKRHTVINVLGGEDCQM